MTPAMSMQVLAFPLPQCDGPIRHVECPRTGCPGPLTCGYSRPAREGIDTGTDTGIDTANDTGTDTGTDTAAAGCPAPGQETSSRPRWAEQGRARAGRSAVGGPGAADAGRTRPYPVPMI